jgi:segregation and condensation protein A
MSFEVKLEKFDGPLYLLLELIQNEGLPITDVSISKVADSFVKYIDSQDVPTSEVADFLVMATRLLLLKSQALLPVEIEPEEDPSMLATQLRIYQEFVKASEKIEAMFNDTARSFARMQPDIVLPKEVEVPKTLVPLSVHDAFAGLLDRLEPFFRLQRAAILRVISVKDRLNEIHEAILARSRLSFKEMVSNGKSRVDVVVSFLALLELIKMHVVNVVQKDVFHDIEIKKAN